MKYICIIVIAFFILQHGIAAGVIRLISEELIPYLSQNLKYYGYFRGISNAGINIEYVFSLEAFNILIKTVK